VHEFKLFSFGCLKPALEKAHGKEKNGNLKKKRRRNKKRMKFQ